MRNAKKFDTYTHAKTRTTFQIYVGNGATVHNHGVFLCQFNGQTFSDAVLANLKLKLDQEAEKAANVTWIPVIQIDTPATHDQRDRASRDFDRASHEVSLRFDRYYLGRMADGTMKQVGWGVDPKDRLQRAEYMHGRMYVAGKWVDIEITLPEKPIIVEEEVFDDAKVNASDKSRTIYVNYTDELWAGLNEIVDRMLELQRRINAFLATERGRSRLAANVSRLLPERARS